MRITHPILALAACFSGTVLAVPQAAGATCFDAGDCILAVGHHPLNKKHKQILAKTPPRAADNATNQQQLSSEPVAQQEQQLRPLVP